MKELLERINKRIQQKTNIQPKNKDFGSNRLTPAEAIKIGKNPRMSAVLILLFPEDNQWQFVLTKRKEYEGVHSKQISLPGGKKEISDLSLEATALRETHEEIGVHSSSINIIGELTSIYIPPSNFIVQPFVGYVTKKPNFIPEDKEVDRIILTPISRLLENDVIKKTNVDIDKNTKMLAPYFDIDHEIVWGASAMILNEFRRLIKP